MPRFKYRDGVAPNLAAIGYATLGHLAALTLLFAPAWPANVVGIALTVHTLMIGTYLLHEAIHETIFATHAQNDMLGHVVAFLGGGGWAGYAELRKKHLHHHSGMMDPTTFDFRSFLDRAPHPVVRTIEALEWLHVPAVELLLRAEHALRPFRDGTRGADRPRMLMVAAASLGWWSGLCLLSVRACLLYAVSYLLFVIGLRVFDAFHHTFDLVVVPDYDTAYVLPPGRDRFYEHANTFSNVIGRGRPRANLFVLNFAYHNAHHAKPGVPWHRLPDLDRTLYRGKSQQKRSIAAHLRDFHRYRLERIRRDTTDIPPAPDGRIVNIGAVAVSLLTL
jgi:fatty acid desaturase